MFRVDKSDWRYGPAGFTNTPEVRALLTSYEETLGTNRNTDDVIAFYGLPLHEGEQLLKLLPEKHKRNRQNESPSFEEFIELGREFPEIRFHGYRVAASRWDERITIEGYLYPDGIQAERLYERVCEIASKPDEYSGASFAGKPLMRAWWD